MPTLKFVSGLEPLRGDQTMVSATAVWRAELLQQLVLMTSPQRGIERMRRRRYDEGTFTREGGLAWTPANVGEELTYHIPEGFNPENPSVDRLYLRIGKSPEIDRITGKIVEEVIRTAEELGDDSWDGPIRIRFHLIGYYPEDGEKSVATPDCIHQDGVRWTSIVLVDRSNIEGGNNLFFRSGAAGKRIGHPELECVAEYSLEESLDMIVWNDEELSHYVTPMRRGRGKEGAWRVILVVDIEPQAESEL